MVSQLKGNILITGGAGFLGRGIMRRAIREGWDCNFTILSRDENKQVQCRAQYPDARYVIGDVTDLRRLMLVAVGHDVIIHAAALKFIPEGEFNADECVRINIDGARAVIEAAGAAGVAKVVGISTDKAAMPVNIYGMTKAVMERLFSEAGFNTCRYGNVVGSTGSVVPVMLQQYVKTGQVCITDPTMTRFWMSVDQAVDTICAALDSETRGAVTIPSPSAADMLTMARAVLARARGISPYDITDDDPSIQIVGVRPGEKLHEDLVTPYETNRLKQVGLGWEILPPGHTNMPFVDTRWISSNLAPRHSASWLATAIADSESV